MALADGTQCFLNGGRMMRKVVVHDDSIHFTANLEPALDAFKRGKRAANDFIWDSQISGNDNRTERVLHIKCAGQWNRERAGV